MENKPSLDSSPERIAEASKLLLQARHSVSNLAKEPFALLNEGESYAVQRQLAAGLGGCAGWKVARDSARGVIRAPLFHSLCLQSPATVVKANFPHFRVECELALVFGEPLSGLGRVFSKRDVQSAVHTLRPAFEIVDSRFSRWPEVDWLWSLADGLSHGAFVSGEGVALRSPAQLESAMVHFAIDGQLMQEGQRQHPLGDPWDVLVTLINRLNECGDSIRAGDIVTTGSFTGAIPLEAGQVASIHFDGVGECKLTLV